ncbi:hypothetical protein P3X46_015544 [Hevea brasiliensis]|uniref:Uncharacterized protein n=1 Tax=Hevea brasiliensis TaxID=3981 RepID=A0ABQ9LWA5_HEVBR|nr:hypothetical protein P3X46_015544 [Hevea brasiliensis]
MSSPQVSINHSFFASAPTSPTSSLFHQNMCFYSVPTSPTREVLEAVSDLGITTTTTTTTPTTYEDINFNLDDFEFETSRRFNDDDSDSETSQKSEAKMADQQEGQRKRQMKRQESLPAMAFADELFCDGKVMPLNPPPRQQYSNTNSNASDIKFGKYSSNPSSPGNQSSLFKIPFTRRSLWNDDFDPFMVALETVKEDKKRGNHRRALSMLPLRACTQWDPDEFMAYEHEKCLHSSPLILCPNKQMEPNGSASATPIWMGAQQLEKEGTKSPIKLAEPKGVLFARRARMVKMGYEWPNKTTSIAPTSVEPIVQAGENAGLGVRPCTTRNKWPRIMSFTLRSSSMSRKSNEHEQTDQNVEFSRPKILRKLSFRSKKLVHGNKQKEVSQTTKMTLVRYRPKLLLCMGYGAKNTSE